MAQVVGGTGAVPSSSLRSFARTGGTAAAAGKLVRGLGAELTGWSFVLEIGGLGGGARLAGSPSHVLLAV